MQTGGALFRDVIPDTDVTLRSSAFIQDDVSDTIRYSACVVTAIWFVHQVAKPLVAYSLGRRWVIYSRSIYAVNKKFLEE